MQTKPDGNDGGVARPGRAENRSQIREATLRVAGEVGYRHLSVQRVLEHYGGYRAQFYANFPNVAASYEEAYAVESERLCETLLAAGRIGPSWRDGLEAALERLAEFACAQTTLAHGLLVEPHLAGEPVLQKRQEVFERLSRAIDSARRETESRHSPPPLTAVFIIHALDAAMADALMRGAQDRFPSTELANLVALYYGLSSMS